MMKSKESKKSKKLQKCVDDGSYPYNNKRLNNPDLRCTQCNNKIPLGDLLIQADFEFEDSKDDYIGYFCSQKCELKYLKKFEEGIKRTTNV